MNREAELLDRIASLETRVAQLEARPQPTYAFGGAGNYWPWGTMFGLPQTTGAIGTNVSRETPLRSHHSVPAKGLNGAAGPIGSAENPLIVKDR